MSEVAGLLQKTYTIITCSPRLQQNLELYLRMQHIDEREGRDESSQLLRDSGHSTSWSITEATVPWPCQDKCQHRWELQDQVGNPEYGTDCGIWHCSKCDKTIYSRRHPEEL